MMDGFNMTDASLDEKASYMEKAFANMWTKATQTYSRQYAQEESAKNRRSGSKNRK